MKVRILSDDVRDGIGDDRKMIVIPIMIRIMMVMMRVMVTGDSDGEN